MRRRSFSLYALVLVTGISCAQGNGVVSDPMEAEAVTPGAEAGAMEMQEAQDGSFADMDMSVEALLAMEPDGDLAQNENPTQESLGADVEVSAPTKAVAATAETPEPVTAAPVQAARKKVAPSKKKAFTKEESVPVVTRDPMEPEEGEEVVASPVAEPLDEPTEVASANTDPEPILSPFDEEVALADEEMAPTMEASTGISEFLTRHPWMAMLGLLGLLGGSFFLWSRNRHQS